MKGYRFSSHSQAALKTCDPQLREIMNRAIKEYDFSIICGFRGEQDQNEAYDRKQSKVRWPNGKHNCKPSKAVDIAPYPIVWMDTAKFCELSKIIKRIADELLIVVKWGGDWGWDLGHYELVE